MTQAPETTAPKRKSFKLYALVSLLVATIAAGIGVFVAVAPATAASLTQRPDAQVAAFVVPLALLLFAVVFEVTRFAIRAPLPTAAPRRARQPRGWKPGRNEG
jgi:hypothetical protein